MEEFYNGNGQVPPRPEMSVGQWFITLLLTAIPLVNLIMLLIWAFGGDNLYPARRNWAKANLVMMVIGIALCLIFGSMFMAGMVSMMNY